MGLSPRAASLAPYVSISAPILALAVNVVVQVLFFRIRKGLKFFRSVVEGFLAGAMVLGVCEGCLIAAGTGETVAMALLVNLPLYGCLSYCFFNFANLGQASIRIRIYSEIAGASGGKRIEDILEEYNEAILARTRLQRLFESGDIARRNEICHVGRKRFVLIALPIFAMKKFLLGKRSEFE